MAVATEESNRGARVVEFNLKKIFRLRDFVFNNEGDNLLVFMIFYKRLASYDGTIAGLFDYVKRMRNLLYLDTTTLVKRMIKVLEEFEMMEGGKMSPRAEAAIKNSAFAFFRI